MKCITALLSMVLPCVTAPVAWEHGYKTDYVVATRYTNDMIGYNIGFVFPKQPYDSDRSETFEFFSQNKCYILQGGGGPGAALYAKCVGVTDRETANAKLLDFLPKLDAHMRGLR